MMFKQVLLDDFELMLLQKLKLNVSEHVCSFCKLCFSQCYKKYNQFLIWLPCLRMWQVDHSAGFGGWLVEWMDGNKTCFKRLLCTVEKQKSEMQKLTTMIIFLCKFIQTQNVYGETDNFNVSTTFDTNYQLFFFL